MYVCRNFEFDFETRLWEGGRTKALIIASVYSAGQSVLMRAL